VKPPCQEACRFAKWALFYQNKYFAYFSCPLVDRRRRAGLELNRHGQAAEKLISLPKNNEEAGRFRGPFLLISIPDSNTFPIDQGGRSVDEALASASGKS
jgi:hypothetical protein